MLDILGFNKFLFVFNFINAICFFSFSVESANWVVSGVCKPAAWKAAILLSCLAQRWQGILHNPVSWFLNKNCALTIFKQIIYKLSIYFCIWWMISPEYIDSIIKYLNAWNLFLAYLYKWVGLFFKKCIYYMIIFTC